ncbi:hypothetical protein AN478_12660 [Thiohalorhabdus denitrificans]|nr:hypothetical protein AN478_12660 [Thiohalorhabdus denitrificans]
MLAAILGLASLAGAAVPAMAAGDDAENGGEESFLPPEVQVCMGCHTIDRDDRQGAGSAPSLWGVVGREPAVDGVRVSRWDEESLQRWLANPRAMAPDTTSRFPGYADPAARERVIEFLKGL